MSLEISETTGELQTMLAAHTQPHTEWTQPIKLDLSQSSDRTEVTAMIRTGQVSSVTDPLQSIANDLFEYENPDKKDDEVRRAAYVGDVLSQGEAYGNWFYMPWSARLIHYPEVDQHRALRTARNRPLISEEEQRHLYASTPAVFGLSVGSKVVESLVTSGIGGTIIMGDPDVIEPTNLNRISGGFDAVGEAKIDHMAKKISMTDPYIRQIHFRDGLTTANLSKLADHRPDVVFDEIDNLPMKAAIRSFGRANKVPVVMATDLGERSLVDVERHDVEPTEPFNGRLKPADFGRLEEGKLDRAEMGKMTMHIVGMRHVTARMLESVIQMDKTISGVPQLGITATVGASMATIAAREIILGRTLNSGRYVYSPKKIMDLDPGASVRDTLNTIRRFVKAKQK